MSRNPFPALFLVLAWSAHPPSAPAGAADWPQFRGPRAAGVGTDARLPDRWSSTENVDWKTDIAGRSWSSPIARGDRVFLTTVVNSGESEPPKKGLYFGGERPEPSKAEHEWKVLALDLATGKVTWDRTVHRGAPSTPIHLKSSYGAETPVTDGDRVYALFGGVGIFALTRDGQESWSRPLTPRKMRYGWGNAASPVLHDGRLYVVDDNDERSEMFALDARTGRELWRIDRDEKSNWATPFVWDNGRRVELVAPGSRAVRSYDLDGKLLWSLTGMSTIAIPTPLAGDGLLFVSSGYVGDKLRPLYAIRPGATGDISLAPDTTSNDHIAWSHATGGPYNPSPLYYDGRIYVLYDRGLVSCYEARTGKILYDRERLPDGFAFTSSPWAAHGRVFCLNEDGKCYVLRAGDAFEILHVNTLADDDMCLATPAMAGDRLLIRTAARLYAIRGPADPASGSGSAAVSAWPQFRGPNGQGVAPEARIPSTFGPESQLVWKTALPAGHSSPVVWGDRVFLTAGSPTNDQELVTLAVDRRDGRVLWRKPTPSDLRPTLHPLNHPTSPTPAVDADHVYSYFGTFGLVCHDHRGNEVWRLPLPTPPSKYGMATSPILYRNTVIMVLDGDRGGSRLLAVERDTGRVAWERPRSLFKAGWSTPMIFRHDEIEELVVLGSKRLTAYDPETGEELWWAGGFPDEPVGIPVTGDGLVFAGGAALGGRGDDAFDIAATWKMTIDEFDRNRDGRIQRDEMTRGFGFIQRPELPRDNPGYAMPIGNMDHLLRIFDHDKDGVIVESEWTRTMTGFTSVSHPVLAAIKPGAKGDARESNLVWESRRGIPETSSIVFTRGRLYLLRDGGLLTCLRAADGAELFRERLGAPGQYIASPVVAGDRLVTASVPGVVTVVEVADELRVLSRNDFREEIYATPALAGNRIYVRTVGHLYALGE